MSRYKLCITKGKQLLVDADRPNVATIYVSFASPYFYGTRLKALVNFVLSHFEKAEIILMGAIYRNSYFSVEYISESKRLALSKQYEDRFRKEEIVRLQSLIDQGKLSVHPVEIYLNAKNFSSHYENVVAFYKVSAAFRKDLEAAARFMFDRLGVADVESSLKEHHHEMLREFVFQELAVFACAVEAGRPLHVYPGKSLEVLDNICRGGYPGAPEILLSVNTIYVQVAKSGSFLRELAE